MQLISVCVILSILSFVNCEVIHPSCDQIRALVDGHNSRRLLLAKGELPGHPAASEMKKMVWDDELYRKAADWAERGSHHDIHYHNPDKKIPSGRFIVGENLYWYSTTDLSYKLYPEAALDTWFNEHKNYTFGPLNMNHFSNMHKQIGHYTQMVWSDTTHVGCAVAKKKNQGWQHYHVVCNYGPIGNYLGAEPYRTNNGASGKLICDYEQCSRPYGAHCK